MKNLHLILIILLIAFAPRSNSQELSERRSAVIICQGISEYLWSDVSTILTCMADKSTNSTIARSLVSSVKHSNGSEIVNAAKIEGLWIDYATVKFIPHDIKNRFLNLEGLRVTRCGLLRVDREDMRQFGSLLKYLDLSSNKLISIDADLFEYNYNLKEISLASNPIRYIEPAFFENLKSLNNIEKIDLTPPAFETGCIEQFFRTMDGYSIANFPWEHECFDENAKVNSKRGEFDIPMISNLSDRMNVIVATNANKTPASDYLKLQRQVSGLETKLNSLAEKLEELMTIVNQLSDKIDNKLL